MALTKVDQTMVSDQVFGRRNVVINGGMQVAQRGTQTGLGASSGVYGATDRFGIVTNGISGRMTTEQSTDAPTGFGNSVKLSCTTADTSLAAGDYLSFFTRLEGRDMQRFKKGTSDAEKYAVSFYVKGNANATYVCELYDYDNFRGVSQTFSVTTAWTRVELSYPADTTGALDNDSNLSFAINIYLHAGSNFNSGTLQTTWSGSGYRATGTDNFFDSTSRTLFLTGVQLEVGDNATPFEHRPYNQELIECRRYFERKQAKANTFLCIGSSYTTTAAYGIFDHQVEKRVAPSISLSGEGNGGSDWQWLTTGGSSPSGTGTTTGHTMTTWNTRLQSSGYSGLTNQNVSGFYSFGTAYVDIDAEL